MHVLREGFVKLLLYPFLELLDDGTPVIGIQIRVEIVLVLFLVDFENLLEIVMINAEHHIGIHLDEAAIAVIGKARVVGLDSKPLHCLVIETQIENRVHHAGHGRTATRAYGDEKRIGRVAEGGSNRFLHSAECCCYLRFQISRILALVRIEACADIR